MQQCIRQKSSNDLTTATTYKYARLQGNQMANSPGKTLFMTTYAKGIILSGQDITADTLW